MDAGGPCFLALYTGFGKDFSTNKANYNPVSA